MAVAHNYANALFELSVEKDCVVSYYNELKIIESVFTEDLFKFFVHPAIHRSEKFSVCQDIFQVFSKDILHFLLLVIEKDRIHDLKEMFLNYEEIYNHFQNIYVADIYTVIPLEQEQVVNLEKVLSVKLEKNLKLNNIVDKSILGGMKIIVDNKVYNYSIENKLEQLKEDLLSFDS